MKEVPLDELESHLAKKISELHSLLATIQSTFERNNTSLALFNLGYRTVYELDKIKRHLNDYTDQIAWSVRNLCELNLVLLHVLESEENLKNWLEQMPSDEKDIIEGFLILKDKFHIEDKERLENRLNGLKATCTRLGLDMKRPWKIFNLAEWQESLMSINCFFINFIRNLFIRQWWICGNGCVDRINSPMYKNLLIGLAQIFVDRNYELLLDKFNIDKSNIISNAVAVPWETPL